MRIPGFAPPAIPLGTTGSRFFPQLVGLSPDDARTHVHVIGTSGSGKSRFLAGLFLALLDQGFSATLIDPHGDLARLVLGHLTARHVYTHEDAFERILYLDFPEADRQGRYLPFNVLRQSLAPHTIAANVVEAMHRAWPALADGVAPAFDLLVLSGVKVLLSNYLPLPLLYRLLTDQGFRDSLLVHEHDREVGAVFRDWYDRLSTRDQLAVAGATLRRVSLLTFDPVLKYSLGQRKTHLDFRDLLDRNRSLVINLALPNPDTRRLLGCLLTVAAEQGALARAALPPAQRSGAHFLCIDEFSEFTAQSEEALTHMLSLTRKYGLFLVMAHQTWSQASTRLRGALQNVGIEVVFRLGRADAEHTATVLGRVDPHRVKHEVADPAQAGRSHPVFYSMPEQWEGIAQAIEDLEPREAFVKRPGRPATRMRTLPVADPDVDPDRLAEVEAIYLQRYFRPGTEVETELEQSCRRTAALGSPELTRSRSLRADR